MIDPNLLRNKLDFVAEQLLKRDFLLEVEKIRTLEKKRKDIQIYTEKLQSQHKEESKFINVSKEKAHIKEFKQSMRNISKKIAVKKLELQKLKSEIHKITSFIPNIPDSSISKSTSEIKRWGTPRIFNFKVQDHVKLGENLFELDSTNAVKIASSRFLIMSGTIARLHRALIQFMLDTHTTKHGYKEYYVPYLANHDSLYGTGQLPKFDKDLFHVYLDSKNKKYSLIPTAEVPLSNLVRNTIITEDSLPIKMTAHTPCFRAEAGSYGRDTHGLIRLHQFEKVEMVQIVSPKKSHEALEEITRHAEKILELLEQPYRRIRVSSKDMSFCSCKTYDIEVWLPSRNKYVEVSSCSNTSDFQSRRMKTRYRRNLDNQKRLVHILNGSGVAVGRLLAAILENCQQANGKISVPQVLHKYMDGRG